ncbi:MAG: hypothetical protein QM775_28200 [Pirellulales bacterium]
MNACSAKFLAKEPKHVEAGILQAEIDLENDRSAAARERMERMVIVIPTTLKSAEPVVGDQRCRRMIGCRLLRTGRRTGQGSATAYSGVDDRCIEIILEDRAEAPPEPPIAAVKSLPNIASADSPIVEPVTISVEPQTAAQRLEWVSRLLAAGDDAARTDIFAAIEAEPSNQVEHGSLGESVTGRTIRTRLRPRVPESLVFRNPRRYIGCTGRQLYAHSGMRSLRLRGHSRCLWTTPA